MRNLLKDDKKYRMKTISSLSKIIIAVLLALFAAGCGRNEKTKTLFSGGVIFPDTASLATKEMMASQVVPFERQYEWQKLEMTAFIHFTVNTFTNKEWGDGTEPESVFNPTEFDAGQWVRTLQEAGMKMVIITAKHHDGFCLWPTETTEHSVKNSPWRDGKGDVLKDLRSACDRYGMKFGIYLSPWDRNAKSYGDSPEYNRFFLAQLNELLTWYGRVDEVWFDGACAEGPNGKKQEYDWEAYYGLVHTLQPDAVIAVMGEDVRWVGTESGYGRDTEWSVTALAPGGKNDMKEINGKLGLSPSSPDLGSSRILDRADRVFWYPSEVDVSIRPGWFYHPEEDNRVKSVHKLVDIYFSSVGKNSLLLLNVPPDRRGLINENDMASLKGFRSYLDSLYSVDMLKGSRPYGQGTSYAIDNDNTTSWSPEGKVSAEFAAPVSITFNVAMLQEDITKGQHVDSFTLDIRKGYEWEHLISGTTIGYKRLLRFPSVTADEVRLNIISSRGRAHISTFSLFRSPEIIADPIINRDKEGNITLLSESPYAVIKYTLDGSEPTRNSPSWLNPVALPDGGIVKCRSYINNMSDSGSTCTEIFDIAPAKWKIVKADAPAIGYEAENMIDGDIRTMYHTPWDGEIKGMPHEVTIDMGEVVTLYGFTYTPRYDENKSGTVERYSFYVSEDGIKWTNTLSPGIFDNIKNNPVKQTVMFSKPHTCRYFRFIARTSINNEKWVSIAEIGVVTMPPSVRH